MPWVMEYVNGISTRARNAGMASSSWVQAIFVTGRTINAPTSTRAGAVARAGMVPSSGDKTRQGRNSSPATTAVRPVRPPASMPTALST